MNFKGKCCALIFAGPSNVDVLNPSSPKGRIKRMYQLYEATPLEQRDSLVRTQSVGNMKKKRTNTNPGTHRTLRY